MTPYNPPLLSVAILDHRKPEELVRLLDSLDQFLQVPAEIVYVHDGPEIEKAHLDRIDTVILTKESQGCGLQTRRLFQVCMSRYVLYCQVDQYLVRPFTQSIFDKCCEILGNPDTFYVDLAGNQGHGRPSERALLTLRHRYLNIPGLEQTIGGPGPYADHPWTEALLQNHIHNSNLRFATLTPPFFADNGVWTIRVQPDGSKVKMRTDTKALWWETVPREKFVFPDLTDEEWQLSFDGKWVGGTVPEKYKAHSFNHWGDIKS